jgi:hypothetical protein
MKIRTHLLFFIGFIVIAYAAYAQVTAMQGIPGSLNSTGCPGGATVCFVQYSAANPMPVVLNR